MKQSVETRPQAYKRITNGIRNFVNHSISAMKLIQEAKRLEIWKEHWGSWQEYCEEEFGMTRQRSYQLLDVAATIEQISDVKPFDTESGENKEILTNLTSRQAHALKGLPPAQKAEVLGKAIKASNGKSPKPETIVRARKSIGPCGEFGGGHVDLDVYTSRRDEVDPADKISKPTKEDTAAVTAASTQYPKTIHFEIFDSQEEDEFVKWSEAIVAKRGQKPKPKKIDMRDAIIKVRNAYKGVTGKSLSVKPLDAGQLRRHLESGIELEEFISVGVKAWKSDGFFSRQSHQLAMFVKHYGNIRNEVSEGGQRHPAVGAQKRGSVPNHAEGF